MYNTIAVSHKPTENFNKSGVLAKRLADELGASVTGLIVDDSGSKQAAVDRLAGLLPSEARPGAPQQAPRAAPPQSDLPFECKTLTGRAHKALAAELGAGSYDLLVVGGVDSATERLLRTSHIDTLVVKTADGPSSEESDTIVVCMDGSPQAFSGLRTAFELAEKFDKKVEAVAVYDPYLHYTLFNGIVGVLTEEASSVFKFADQEKLHEEIIDTGLAKIYQAHLNISLALAREDDTDIEVTLLDGKAFQKLLRHAERRRPWLMIVGRIGVHSDAEMDIGATTENLLRNVPCDVLVTSRTYTPPVDIEAQSNVEWSPEAEQKMSRVPSFVKGVATTAILRWAKERGHSIITASVINSAMGELLPAGAARAMGYDDEDDPYAKGEGAASMQGVTFVCANCGYVARDYKPATCGVCNADGAQFSAIDRSGYDAIAKAGDVEEEETFDGKKLKWESAAKEVLRRVPSGYQRRRSKARIEKSARVRGIAAITHEFAVDVVEQDLAETSYLTPRGETLRIEVKDEEKPDDGAFWPREDSEMVWTDAAWKRLERVPFGFMRTLTREKVETFATQHTTAQITLAICEDGIAEGRKMMADMIGNYGEGGGEKPAWTKAAAKKVEEAKERVTDIGKFTEERAEDLSVGVAEERARNTKLEQIGASFMAKLGKQLGYGHPLAKVTADYEFEWTPEAEAELADVPAFCREMTKWRVEWTAVKKDLGRVITPEIMAFKYEMWGEVSQSILDGGSEALEWDDGPTARIAKIPSFVKGQVIQSVEGNARLWGYERVSDELLDRVIQKWIDTGDFHEAKYGYK